ncbi:hypothetical protein ACBB95_004340 [Salmonella enterica]
MLKCTIKTIRVVNVTFDVFNNKETAYVDDGSTFGINRCEYEKMLWDIKKKGAHIIEEKDYSGNSFQDLMNNIF